MKMINTNVVLEKKSGCFFSPWNTASDTSNSPGWNTASTHGSWLRHCQKSQVVSFLLCCIRLQSIPSRLLVFRIRPERHAHPDAITQLMLVSFVCRQQQLFSFFLQLKSALVLFFQIMTTRVPYNYQVNFGVLVGSVCLDTCAARL